ncbi:MAG: hypothetical protein ACLUFJ_11900, partial [Roseburia faecis]
RIPVACFSCHKNNKISISWLNYNRKQEILLKNLLQNQQNLKADGIYSCTGIYFFKSAVQKRGDVKVSNVTCGYALSSAAIELPRIPAFYPKKTKKKTQQKEIPPLHH